MLSPQFILGLSTSDRVDPSVYFFHRLPTRLEQCICNRVSIAAWCSQRVFKIGVDHWVFVDRGLELHAPSNLETRFKDICTEVRFKLPELNALPYVLHFAQLTDKAGFLNVAFLGRSHSHRNIQTANGGLSHLDKVLCCNFRVSFGGALSAVSYPNCNSNRSDCPDGLHPRSSFLGCERADHIAHAEREMQKCPQQEERHEAKDGPVEGLEVFCHQTVFTGCSSAIVSDLAKVLFWESA
jgi:hypothetical protein